MPYVVDPSNHPQILETVAYVLRTSLTEVGRGIGVSRRTLTRWKRNPRCMIPLHLQRLARLVHPTDPVLAAQIAAVDGKTLADLGLAAPLAGTAPTEASVAGAREVDPKQHLVDAIVCAAAEALDASPRAVRPALVAAFRRARETGLSLADVESRLEPSATSGSAEP